MKAAVERGLKIIAIPGISTGVFKYPVEKATGTIVMAIVDSLKESARYPLTEVVLIDNDPDVVAGFENALATVKDYERPADEEVTGNPSRKPKRTVSGNRIHKEAEVGEPEEPQDVPSSMHVNVESFNLTSLLLSHTITSTVSGKSAPTK